MLEKIITINFVSAQRTQNYNINYGNLIFMLNLCKCMNYGCVRKSQQRLYIEKAAKVINQIGMKYIKSKEKPKPVER